jgi:hypothetical protein
MSLNPREDYPRQSSGEPVGQFETDARTWASKLTRIAEVTDLPTDPLSADVVVDVTKPDARLSVDLEVCFVQHQDIDVTPGLALSAVWLSLLGDVRGDLRPVENIIGTRAAPESFIPAGLWGATWEVDLDCVGARATLRLVSPTAPGTWYARARWTALEPMSQRDWEHARQNMALLSSPKAVPNIGHIAMGPI